MEKKSSRLQIATFIVSLICLFLLGYIIQNHSTFNSSLFKVDVSKLPKRIKGTIEEEEAVKMVDLYRNSITFYKKARLTSYEPVDLEKYIEIFKKYTVPSNPPPIDPIHIAPPENYKWQMAFSLMFTRDENDKARLTVCLLPTLVSTNSSTPNDILDYFEEKEKGSDIYRDYFLALNQKFETEDEKPRSKFKSFIFDEGHLWP